MEIDDFSRFIENSIRKNSKPEGALSGAIDIHQVHQFEDEMGGVANEIQQILDEKSPRAAEPNFDLLSNEARVPQEPDFLRKEASEKRPETVMYEYTLEVLEKQLESDTDKAEVVLAGERAKLFFGEVYSRIYGTDATVNTLNFNLETQDYAKEVKMEVELEDFEDFGKVSFIVVLTNGKEYPRDGLPDDPGIMVVESVEAYNMVVSRADMTGKLNERIKGWSLEWEVIGGIHNDLEAGGLNIDEDDIKIGMVSEKLLSDGAFQITIEKDKESEVEDESVKTLVPSSEPTQSSTSEPTKFEPLKSEDDQVKEEAERRLKERIKYWEKEKSEAEGMGDAWDAVGRARDEIDSLKRDGLLKYTIEVRRELVAKKRAELLQKKKELAQRLATQLISLDHDDDNIKNADLELREARSRVLENRVTIGGQLTDFETVVGNADKVRDKRERGMSLAAKDTVRTIVGDSSKNVVGVNNLLDELVAAAGVDEKSAIYQSFVDVGEMLKSTEIDDSATPQEQAVQALRNLDATRRRIDDFRVLTGITRMELEKALKELNPQAVLKKPKLDAGIQSASKMIIDVEATPVEPDTEKIELRQTVTLPLEKQQVGGEEKKLSVKEQKNQERDQILADLRSAVPLDYKDIKDDFWQGASGILENAMSFRKARGLGKRVAVLDEMEAKLRESIAKKSPVAFMGDYHRYVDRLRILEMSKRNWTHVDWFIDKDSRFKRVVEVKTEDGRVSYGFMSSQKKDGKTFYEFFNLIKVGDDVRLTPSFRDARLDGKEWGAVADERAKQLRAALGNDTQNIRSRPVDFESDTALQKLLTEANEAYKAQSKKPESKKRNETERQSPVERWLLADSKDREIYEVQRGADKGMYILVRFFENKEGVKAFITNYDQKANVYFGSKGVNVVGKNRAEAEKELKKYLNQRKLDKGWEGYTKAELDTNLRTQIQNAKEDL